jgi:hypothetical protein
VEAFKLDNRDRDSDAVREAAEQHKLRTLLNTVAEDVRMESMTDVWGIVIPTVDLAHTLKGVIRDDVCLLAPYEHDRLIDVRTGWVYESEEIDSAVMDLRLGADSA